MKILLLFINILSSYKVIWKNTHIKIPLKENTHIHYDKPEANLYYNDELIDTVSYYEKGVNHTNLNVINSNHVKEFKIDYRVHFEKYNISNTQTITFEIVDIISPEFIYIPEISMPVDEKKLTEKQIIENLIYKDNYYSNDELVVRIYNLENVNNNLPGEYEIIYELMDPSYNFTRVSKYYVVTNNSYPEIKYDEIIKHEYNTYFNYLDYFKITDKYDKNLKITVDTSKVNFNKLGTYQITVKAKNKDNLETVVTTNILIVDTKPPKLDVIDSVVLNIYDYDINYLKELIIDVSDNYDNLSKDDVIISGYVNFNEIGTYKLIYELRDNSNNLTTKNVVINIKDLEKPEIINIKELIIDVSLGKINYYDYFIIRDNHSSFDDLKITFNDKNVNYNELGSYILEIEVLDESKNKRLEMFNVEIKDLIPPKVKLLEEIVITDFMERNINEFKSYFYIEDNYSTYQNIEIDMIGNINYEKVGSYLVTFIFKDESLNETKFETNIIIIDNIAPIITLKTKNMYYYINDDKPNFYNNIISIYDNYSLSENIEINIIEDINYEKVGVYEVLYEAIDEYGNKSYSTLNFYVDVKLKELIKGKDLYINVGDYISKYEGLELSEDVYKIESFPKEINTNQAGIFEILHIAYDIRGNIYEFNQKVHIKDNNIFKKYKNNIIVTIIGTIILISYIIYYKNNSSNF